MLHTFKKQQHHFLTIEKNTLFPISGSYSYFLRHVFHSNYMCNAYMIRIVI